jgi:hypothetical protein
MRAGWMTVGLLLVGCTSSSTDTKDSGIIVEPDDTIETDDPRDSGGWPSTETAVDTERDTELDTDTDAGGPTQPGNDTGRDTAECPFGEIPDCDDVCYPAYFIGDGNCDDGSNFQSNFDCVEFGFDGGDCDDDTDVGVDTDAGGCLYVVHIATANAWAAEVGWQILAPSGGVLYEVITGVYQNGRDYYHTVLLPAGDYEFAKIDSFNDGWNGTQYEIYPAGTQNVVAQGTLPGGSYGRDPFVVTCDGQTVDSDVDTELAACGDLTATMVTTSWGGEASWEIRERATTNPLVSSPAYLSNQTTVTEFALGSGWYELVMRDAFGDGWNGATLTIEDPFLSAVLLEESLVGGAESVVPFYVDCSDTFNPAAGQLLTPTCRDVRLVLHTAGFGADYGWELFSEASAALVAAAPVGTYQSNRTYEIPVAVESGTYNLHLIDAFGDGWSGGYIEVLDRESGIVVASGGQTFTNGTDFWFGFTLACPEDDTDVEPLPDGVCASGAIPDCLGTCWPASYRGDNNCDDGTFYAANFYCAALLWDGGDCGAPPGP